MMLHADLRLPVAVRGAALKPVPSPVPGVQRRMLERDGAEVPAPGCHDCDQIACSQPAAGAFIEAVTDATIDMCEAVGSRSLLESRFLTRSRQRQLSWQRYKISTARSSHAQRPHSRLAIGELQVARCTTLVTFEPSSSFPHHTHGGGEEFLVLAGDFCDNLTGTCQVPGPKPCTLTLNCT